VGFEFRWDDDEKTIMRYSADGDWNWKDYHMCVRMSLFTLHRHETPVDTIIDFRGSTRPTFPSGAQAHVRTFTKKHHPALTGRVVVIGCPPEVAAALGLIDSELRTPDGLIRCVNSDEDAQQVIRQWCDAQTGPASG
jgi:hypothetical protein